MRIASLPVRHKDGSDGAPGLNAALKKDKFGPTAFGRSSTQPDRSSDQLHRPMKYRYLYRVIHKSVKHFKNSQQIDYATDHGNSYVDRERNCLSFF